ncbi:cell filamentation protein Fic [Fusobacterium necrophorum subsp. funduliforme]|uniref:Fic/DOC family protein n=3 Tax=Fusobacterium necrophorum TaxID=859 RepID=A0AAN4AS48_9FUSO|nr:Fic family protein [Fusobacterium necrophorum]AYV94249.1 Fic family protein [Fusobacterium necrophorum subsp. funduliforme]EFS22774.1 Fic family protein [Fusobacterium necrophorum D12]EJU15481.1 Fic/DOC family protein [Fusobacterium necrophorum subsp. funduliforme Fnf 1007]KYL01285.1 cell filamentation protein Fic [Fusobacterium necrophorum subsp. funduliforme]KYL02418.1 cell filamentation protein Fic [Fusobacterium necrophorum subsp. funduliforme]
MENKYKKMEKIYYSDKEYQIEYEKRVNNPASYVTNLKIKTIWKGKKTTEEIPLFYMNLLEHTKLQEKIFQNSQKILNLSQKLPNLAIKLVFDTVLVNEVLHTNQLEGIHSSKKELYFSLKEEKSEIRKQEKINGLIKKYIDIYRKRFEKIENLGSVSQFREIYEELFSNLLGEENYQLDGEIFRKDSVSIQDSSGRVIHRGVSGEKNILMKLNDLLLFMNQEDLPFLLKAAISHFFIEYIHPFCDGNGRFGRYLFSMYLARKLDRFSALSFSYAIQRRKEEYYKSFQDVEKRNNFGEVTFFVDNIYRTIDLGQKSILQLLEENVEAMKKVHKVAEEVSLKNTLHEKELQLLFLYMQDCIFHQFEYISNMEIFDFLKDTSRSMSKLTLNKYTKKMEEKGYLQQIKKRPLTYRLSDTFMKTYHF